MAGYGVHHNIVEKVDAIYKLSKVMENALNSQQYFWLMVLIAEMHCATECYAHGTITCNQNGLLIHMHVTHGNILIINRAAYVCAFSTRSKFYCLFVCP